MTKNFKKKIHKLRKKHIQKRRKSYKILIKTINIKGYIYKKSLEVHKKLIDNKEVEIFLTEY